MPVTHIEEKPKDLMQMMVHDQFAAIFDPIETAKVYIQDLPSNGSKSVTRYSGKDVNLVVGRAEKSVAAIDHMRSPKRGDVYHFNGGFACDVTSYGLD